MSRIPSGKVMAGNAKVVGQAGFAGGKQMAGNAKAVGNSAVKPISGPMKQAAGNAKAVVNSAARQGVSAAKLTAGNVKAVGVTALKGPAMVQGMQPGQAKGFKQGLKPDAKVMNAKFDAQAAVIDRNSAAAAKNLPKKQAAMVDKVMAMDKVNSAQKQIDNRAAKNPVLGSRPLPNAPKQTVPFKPGAKGPEVPNAFKGVMNRSDLKKSIGVPKKPFDPEANGGWPSLED